MVCHFEGIGRLGISNCLLPMCYLLYKQRRPHIIIVLGLDAMLQCECDLSLNTMATLTYTGRQKRKCCIITSSMDN